jgi:succinate dehydrogenase/fumarate reductase cytochrome b subunit
MASAPGSGGRVIRRTTWSTLVAVAASAALVLVGLWEIASPQQGGHWASMAACGIAAENMLRYHLFAAVTHYVADPPPLPAEYYARHPYAIYVLEAIARVPFGHHPWVLRLPALACSAATPLVMHRLSRALWGPIAGAVAAVAFVIVPVDLAFSIFSSLEVPTILFGLLFCLGTVRLWETGRREDLWMAGAGALGACHSDWIGFVLVGLVLAFGGVRLLLPRVRTGLSHPAAYRRWLVVGGALLVGTLLLYAWLIVRSGQWTDLMHGARMRSMNMHPLGALGDAPREERRLMRLQWMVPWVGFAAMPLALLVTVPRLGARPGGVVVLAWIAMASVQYLLFPQGADMHTFWPHYFGPCVALSLGAIAGWLVEAGRDPRVRAAGLAVAIALPMLLLTRMAIPMLDWSRLTQGRFDERGLFIESGVEAAQFAAWATRDAPPDAITTCMHLCGANLEYASERPSRAGPVVSSQPAPSDRERIGMVDARSLPSSELRRLVARYGVDAVGPFLRVDRGVPGGGVRAIAEEERQPRGLEKLFVTDHDLVRTIGGDDPWMTWQWAESLDTPLPAAPAGTPLDLDAKAIAYNVAVSTGDAARAASLRAEAVSSLAWSAPAEMTDDTRLLGGSVEGDVVPVVRLLWETGPGFVPPAKDSSFYVRCDTTHVPALWIVPEDPLPKYISPPMLLRPSMWKASHLYVQRFVWLRRPVAESCQGAFEPAEPRPRRGGELVDLGALLSHP